MTRDPDRRWLALVPCSLSLELFLLQQQNSGQGNGCCLSVAVVRKRAEYTAVSGLGRGMKCGRMTPPSRYWNLTTWRIHFRWNLKLSLLPCVHPAAHSGFIPWTRVSTLCVHNAWGESAKGVFGVMWRSEECLIEVAVLSSVSAKHTWR